MFWIVQLFPGREFLVILEVLGAEGLGYCVFFAQPFAEIDELATF